MPSNTRSGYGLCAICVVIEYPQILPPDTRYKVMVHVHKHSSGVVAAAHSRNYCPVLVVRVVEWGLSVDRDLGLFEG